MLRNSIFHKVCYICAYHVRMYLIRLSDACISRFCTYIVFMYEKYAVKCDDDDEEEDADNRTMAIARHQFFQFITYFYQHICQSAFF